MLRLGKMNARETNPTNKNFDFIMLLTDAIAIQARVLVRHSINSDLREVNAPLPR